MADIAQKWVCEQCTYENFLASSKCVVCGYCKRHASSAVDIYNLAYQPATKVHSAVSAEQSVTTKEDPPLVDHWVCSACTLVNGIWLETCSACRTRRDDMTATLSASVKSNSSSSPPSRTSKSASNSQTANAVRLAAYLPKWRCSNCTYDNYPKSHKCVMCQRPKSVTPAEFTCSTGKQAGIEHVPSVLGGNSPDSVSPRISPQGSVANLNEVCSGVAASSSVTQQASTIGRKQSQSEFDAPKFVSSVSFDASGSSNAASLQSNGSRHHTSISCYSSKFDLSSLFIAACKAVYDGSSEDAINLFLLYGGDPRQKLTTDDIHQIVEGAGACDLYAGQTLVDLAVAFKRESVIQLLLSAVDSFHSQQYENSRRKTLSPRRRSVLPCQLCPDLASDIRFLFGAGLRQAKETAFPCYYFARDPVTFSLPSDVYTLPSPVRLQLVEDIVDHQVQNELESEGVLNWSAEVVFNLGSRLYALCNRAAGDCLLDSVMQTMWGVMDRSNVLRRAMASALYEAENAFCQCWRSYETSLNERLGFTLDESQWDATWQKLLDFASSQGQSLEELHIFALAHVLRRPIIVYSPNFVRSRVSGDKIGESSFQGVYLPLLWDRQFCHRNPIALAYTLGHFSALVAIQSDETTVDPRGSGERAVYLPLQDSDGKLFPVHFSRSTSNRRLLTDWLDCWKTCRTHMLVAQQRLDPPPIAVRQMINDWLMRYSSMYNSAAVSSDVPPYHFSGVNEEVELSENIRHLTSSVISKNDEIKSDKSS